MKNNFKLKICWLYPDLMSTYGDRGNILIFKNRMNWRDISCEIIDITLDFSNEELKKADIIFMGGAQDRQQEIVSDDLVRRKDTIKKLIESGIPGLFICGAYQFLGNFYLDSNGQKNPGLEIFDIHTINPGANHKRLIGNIEAKILIPELKDKTIVGFENHGGRTYLSDKIKPFAKVISGNGNNGNDKTEGAIYKNAIGTYLHGPILANNPCIADFLICQAIKTKYGENIHLEILDDRLEKIAIDNLINKS
jgi:CobQ-like glutamine amidotransferase family enzyme